MSTVRTENQQNPIPSKKPRLLRPFEGFVLAVALLMLFFELFTTFNHNMFYSQVSDLKAKWSYARENHIPIDKLSAFQMRLSKLESEQFGPFPASWFPRIDGLETQLHAIQKDTNTIWIGLASAKRLEALAALSHLKKTEGDFYKKLEKSYKTALDRAKEPQDYEKLAKKWKDLSKNWVESQNQLEKISGGLIDKHPADIVHAEKGLDKLQKELKLHPDDNRVAGQVLQQTKQYFQMTPIDMLKQHDEIEKKLTLAIQKLEKDAAPKKLDVPLINQLADPGLFNGCEVTSLAMILRYAGYDVTKNKLANQIPKVPVHEEKGLWGNPNKGFVGDIDGSNPGYFVYHGPIADLAKKYAGKKVQDLTGSDLSVIYKKIAEGIPVLVYTTTDFKPHGMDTWKTPQGKVKITMFEHCVVLTGFSKKYVWINNPYGLKNERVDRSQFEKSWIELGRQAVVVNK